MVDSQPVAHEIVVWLVEDNRFLRCAIADSINDSEGMCCPMAVEMCEEALAALTEDPVPDIVLMDIGLPGMNGIEGTRRIRSLSPASRVIMLTIHEESEKIFEAICAGASGYLLKPSSTGDIVDAIRQVQMGAAPINAYIARKMLRLFARLSPRERSGEDYGLTPREQEILQRLVDGLTMRKISERLGLSYHTVDTHIRNIYEKLHVRSRTGAVTKALREELV